MDHAFPSFELEVRQRAGSVRSIAGRFAYGATATIRDRGRVRKERIAPRAFSFSLDEGREVNLLRGHSFDEPLATTRNGSLRLRDTDEALSFEADLPPVADRPSYMVDTLRMIEADLLPGLSPGFRIPPASAVPDAEVFLPDPEAAGVQIRLIQAAVLFELSIVTRPAYSDTEVDMRSLQSGGPPVVGRARHRRVLF